MNNINPSKSMLDSQPPAPMQNTEPSQQKVPFYRSYWIFGAIYIILPPIIGLIVLLTGNIYRKQKDGQVHPIRKREKMILTVLAVIIWGLLILFSYTNRSNNVVTMKSWLNANQTSFNASTDNINGDIVRIQADSNTNSNTLVIEDFNKLLSDLRTARAIPTMPDKIAAGYYDDYLNNLQKAANSTIDSIKTQSNQSAQDAVLYLQKANVSRNKLQERVKADGISIGN